MSFSGYFMVNSWERYVQKAKIFCFNSNLELLDLVMGEPSNSHFYDFGISGRVLEPRNHLFLFSATPGYFKKCNKSQKHDKETVFLLNFGNTFCWQRRAPNNREVPFLEILNTASISSRKHEMEFW